LLPTLGALDQLHREILPNRKGTWANGGPAKSGWNLRYRRNGKSLTALRPQQERVLAQVVLGKAQAERPLQLELGEKISRMLQEAP